MIELDADAAALRRRGGVVAWVQLATVNVGIVALSGDFAWVGVGVGRPGGSLRSLGAAREHLSNETWHGEIADRMGDAVLIALAPGETEGLTWELNAIVEGHHLGKTLFVFPPLAPSELDRRWRHTSDLLRAAGVPVASLPISTALAHTVRISDAGSLWLTAAQTRDEATYRTAVDRAIEQMPMSEAELAVT